MDTRWTEDLLRLNTRIVTVETRFVARVTELLAQEADGQDATKMENLVIADGKMLCLLRQLRDVMMDEIADED